MKDRAVSTNRTNTVDAASPPTVIYESMRVAAGAVASACLIVGLEAAVAAATL